MMKVTSILFAISLSSSLTSATSPISTVFSATLTKEGVAQNAVATGSEWTMLDLEKRADSSEEDVAAEANENTDKEEEEENVKDNKNKDNQQPKTTKSPVPQLKPWIRTRTLPSTTITQLVTPTIWGGVTFSASPRTHSKVPLPWLSLDKEGQIKTISPKVKNGVTQNLSPNYGTWFDDVVTETVNLKTKMENVKEDTHHVQIEHVHEDTTDRELNPIIRCTPDRYFKKKRRAKRVSSQPFCTPREGARFFLDSTYWISWYTKYFKDVEKVRLHLAYVSLNKYGKVGKRDFIPGDNYDQQQEEQNVQEHELFKRDTEQAFWTSEWISNLDGVFPLEITEDMFEGMPVQDIMLTIQPEDVPDEDFSLITNGTYIKLYRQPIKGTGEKKIPQLPNLGKKFRNEDEGDGSTDSVMYLALTIPTILVVVFVVLMMLNMLFRRNRTWKSVRIKSKRKGNLFGRGNNKYSKLPSNTYELDRMD